MSVSTSRDEENQTTSCCKRLLYPIPFPRSFTTLSSSLDCVCPSLYSQTDMSSNVVVDKPLLYLRLVVLWSVNVDGGRGWRMEIKVRCVGDSGRRRKR